MEDKEILEEDFSQYEETENEDEELEETETKEEQPQQKDYLTIVKETVTGVIEDYARLAKTANDEFFLIGYENTKKNVDECINYVMNNLTQKRIYGGRDSLMYPYIHDYYVDDIKEELLKDNWSSYLRNPNTSTPKPKAELTEEQKEKLMKKAEEEFILEQKRILQEQEKKKLEKEKARLQKQKEREAEKEIQKAIEEQKAKEEAKKNGAGEQMSLFDDL